MAVKAPRWRNRWSIGLYRGPSPLALRPLDKADRPALTARDVTDIPAQAVADPFLLRRDGLWHMFFEVMNGATDLGEIAHATSPDGLAWSYGAVVLREPFHLSYPQVFAWDGAVWMVPETRQAESVRLYRATDFPRGWECVGTLLHGRYADATLLNHDGRWWMFAQRGLDEMRLFMADRPDGPWREHPASPLWPGNRSRTRPGGRMLVHEGRILRFAQDGWPSYGSRLCVFEIDRLTETDYAEHELPESPILRATGTGWNAVGMHHIDAVPTDDGDWLAAVDGASLALY
ncbi:glucosamine inositolphosphorylceramide transferase family protein [Azospirillum sp. sgz302134]